MSDYIELPEAASIIGVSVRTVREYLDRGYLPRIPWRTAYPDVPYRNNTILARADVEAFTERRNRALTEGAAIDGYAPRHPGGGRKTATA